MEKKLMHPRTHKLKLANEFWEEVLSGRKTAEIRKHDRPFEVGDFITFGRVGLPSSLMCNFWGLPIKFEITHILKQSDFPDGVKSGFCLLSIKK